MRLFNEHNLRVVNCLDGFWKFKTDENNVGAYVWHANIRTSKRMSLNRARGYNNKGIVDEYRRPKLAYYAIKEIYSKIK